VRVYGNPGWFALRLHAAHSSCLRRYDLAAARIEAAITGADLVVSTYPLASLVLGRLRRNGLPTPVITFLTDLSVHPLWISDAVDLHLAPHAVAAEQARSAGAADVRVVAPPVDVDRFKALPADERHEIRRRYGLPEVGKLALISSGSWGVGAVAATARDVARTGEAIPVIACGHNDALRRRLNNHGYGPAIGWTNEMPALIGACDVVVTNAGGITALESIACEVPVVAYRPLPGHGVTNADALRASGLGVCANDATQLAKRLADPWPLPFDALAVSRPADIFAYPDSADTILSQLRQGPLESEAAEPALSVMR